MTLLRGQECRCVWLADDRYGQCPQHHTQGYKPKGREYAWLTFRAGQVMLFKSLVVGPLILLATAIPLAVLATPIIALAASGYTNAAFWVGMGYVIAGGLALVGWLSAIIHYSG